MSVRRTLALGVLLLALTPAAARADGFIIPFANINFAGDAGQSFGDGADAKRLGWGVSFGWMGGGIFGLEGDIGFNPDFYGKNDVGGSSVLSLMGNLLVGVPFGGQQGFGVRPFGVVGVGVLNSDLESFDELAGFENNEVAWNFGGGLMIFFGQHVGIRGDIRYFRTLGDVDFGLVETSDTEAVDYGRGSIGFVFRF